MELHNIRDSVTVQSNQPASGSAVPQGGYHHHHYQHHHQQQLQPPVLRLETSSSPENSRHGGGGGGGGGSVASPASERSFKIAACMSCRKSKVRCEKGPDPVRCRRCVQAGSECVRPTFNVGRRKGVKNKRKGLEKALYQVEEALRRVGPGVQSTDAGKAIVELKTMLANSHEAPLSGATDGRGGASGASNKRPRLATASSAGDQEDDDSSSDEDDEDDEDPISPADRRDRKPNIRGSQRRRRESAVSPQQPQRRRRRRQAGGRDKAVQPEERLAVDDAENPLQLLARASNLHLSPESGSHVQSPGTAAVLPGPAGGSVQAEELLAEMRQVQAFFGTTHFNVDRGEDYDPIDMGLVTEAEAEMLFDFFHKNLSHTRWGLDPVIYNAPWTRGRSPFLFTTIMASSALFIESAAALSKRLRRHVKTLAARVCQKRHRSAEIVLAFMINVPWMGPGVHSTDDETCWFVALATTIAIDLQMGKLSMPGERFRNGSTHLLRQDCIDPELALRSGGFGDVDPNSELGRRLLRRRERCWIALFVLERGMCLARGRPYTLPMTPLIREVDRWHISDIADSMDGALVSMAVLRRDLDGVFDTIRSMCNGSTEGMTDGSLIAQSIQTTVDKFFEQWYLEWGQTIGQGPQNRLPPYVEILVTHTRLSIYSSVINTPSATLEVRHFFRTASLSAALNVMRAAVQGEKQLFSMPNNTAIMVSFAACFALRLSSQIAASSTSASSNTAASLAPSVRTLIEELSDVLEKIGNVTRHRNGMCPLYAKYLRILVRKAAAESGAAVAARGPRVPGMARGGPGSVYADVSLQGFRASGGGAGKSATTPGLSTLGGFALPPPPPRAPPSGLGPYEAPGTAASWTPAGAGVGGGGASSGELFPFSSMSGDQIVETLSRAGGEFDVGGDGGAFGTGLGAAAGGVGDGGGGGGGGGSSALGWEEGMGLDFLPTWNHWPDLGF